MKNSGRVKDADDDRRVRDVDLFLDARRRECLAMLALWERSRKPHANEEYRHWRLELNRIDRQAAKILQREENR